MKLLALVALITSLLSLAAQAAYEPVKLPTYKMAPVVIPEPTYPLSARPRIHYLWFLQTPQSGSAWQNIGGPWDFDQCQNKALDNLAPGTTYRCVGVRENWQTESAPAGLQNQYAFAPLVTSHPKYPLVVAAPVVYWWFVQVKNPAGFWQKQSGPWGFDGCLNHGLEELPPGTAFRCVGAPA